MTGSGLGVHSVKEKQQLSVGLGPAEVGYVAVVIQSTVLF